MEWFRERLVWNDPAQVRDLVRSGLFYRIYTPQACHFPLSAPQSSPFRLIWRLPPSPFAVLSR